MKHFLLPISQNKTTGVPLDAGLSFKPFSDFLKRNVEAESTIVKTKFFNFLIQKFNEYPELDATIKVETVNKYTELLELIYSGMTGITGDEVYWVLATPDSRTVFYGTEPFYNLISNVTPDAFSNDAGNENTNNNLQLSFIYSLLLENIYDYKSLVKAELIQPFADTGEGIMKYYKMNIDSTFVKVEAKSALPKLDLIEMEIHVNDNTLIEYLSKILPLKLFSFTGFTVITLYDRTEEYVVKKIKDSIVNSNNPNNADEVIAALKALAGNREINFKLIPFVKLNDKFLLEYSETLISQSLLQKLMEAFQKKSKPIFLKNFDNTNSEEELITELQKTKMVSYALLPLLHNNQLTGALEIHTEEKDLLTEKIIARINTTVPVLSQFMKNSIDDFNSQMPAVVYERFTAIQKSVQWKFHEAAWRYMRTKQKLLVKTSKTTEEESDTEIINFKCVYPLYGAIDIRNFSLARSKALLDDLRLNLNLLTETFTALKLLVGRPTTAVATMNGIDEMISKCKRWVEKLVDGFDDNENQKLNLFFEKEVLPLLTEIKQADKTLSDIIEKYLNELNEKTGSAHKNRRDLEKSLRMITRAVSNNLEQMNDEFQKTYPCYFDKFRSDGIEYDIYIGESITNDKHFEPVHLKSLRIEQIKSMAAINSIATRLLKTMPKELHTTYLIFINGEPIDIYFRNDEKRFDVEGTYNIRYQMIKKRIDKVHLLNSEERLTQPDKIAMVYLNQQDADEYVGFIKTLQDEKILNNDLEYLDLEELLGVQSLKALRVGITSQTES